jgi:hypothetical protein
MEWEKIGEIAVDSGTFLICDPCYMIQSKYRDKITLGILQKITVEKNHNTCVGFSKDDPIGLGVVGTTKIGDGLFPVYERITEEGVKEVKIVFFQE